MQCRQCAVNAFCRVSHIAARHPARLVVAERSLPSGASLLSGEADRGKLFAIKVGGVVLRHGLGQRPANHKPVAVLGRKHILGMMAMLSPGTCLEAETYMPSRVCELDASMLRSMIEHDPHVSRAMALAVSSAASEALSWSLISRLPDAHARLLAALQQLSASQEAQVIHLPDRPTLAALCGCAEETISRVMTALVHQGAISRLGRQRIALPV